MSPRTLVLFAAAVTATAAAPRLAAADCYDDTCRDARDREWSRPRFEGGFGLLAGSYTVSSVHGGGVGLHVDGGVRMGRLALLGEYDFLSVGQDAYTYENPIRGVLHRVGANARYSVAAFGGRAVPIRGDIWLEGGVGSQLVQWHGGGELSRRDLAFGVGGQMTVQHRRREAAELPRLLLRVPRPGRARSVPEQGHADLRRAVRHADRAVGLGHRRVLQLRGGVLALKPRRSRPHPQGRLVHARDSGNPPGKKRPPSRPTLRNSGPLGSRTGFRKPAR
jgi:hypothetical protein